MVTREEGDGHTKVAASLVHRKEALAEPNWNDSSTRFPQVYSLCFLILNFVGGPESPI